MPSCSPLPSPFRLRDLGRGAEGMNRRGREGGGGVKGLELGMAFEVSPSKCFCARATVALSMPPFHTVSLFTMQALME